jgi:hypothetical protein
MKNTVGYIVNGGGGVKGLVKDVLWFTGSATLFATRKDARAAIKRTSLYATNHAYQWGIEDWQIVRVKRA